MCACRGLESELKVAYLGPRGTFSEQAMIRQFGSGVVGMPSGSIEEVFRKVESGDAAYGIVPIENSTEGAVNRTMDCLLKTPLFIVGECSIPIQHNLMTRSGSMEGVTRVYSHPQSLGQCVQWLNRNVPSLERLTAESNGEAARLASENPTYAAVAGEVAAKITFLEDGIFRYNVDPSGEFSEYAAPNSSSHVATIQQQSDDSDEYRKPEAQVNDTGDTFEITNGTATIVFDKDTALMSVKNRRGYCAGGDGGAVARKKFYSADTCGRR